MPFLHLSHASHRRLRLAVAAVLLAACSGDASDPTAPPSLATAPAGSATPAPTGRAALTSSGRFYDGPVELTFDSAMIAWVQADARAQGYDTLGPGKHVPQRPTLSLAGSPSAEVGAAAAGSWTVGFDDIEGSSVDRQYAALGVRFSGAYRVPSSEAFPAKSGTWSITGPSFGFLGIRFAELADEVRLVVTSPYSLAINCEGFRPDGSYGSLVFFELPGRSFTTPLNPYPVHEEITLTGPGIFECWVLGRGFGYVIDDVQWTRLGGAAVAVTCADSAGRTTIERGRFVTCTATTTGGAQLTKWRAVGADGDEWERDVRNGAQNPNEWKGLAVLTTTVTATVTVPGRADSVTSTPVTFTVSPRPWSLRMPAGPISLVETGGSSKQDLAYPPSREAILERGEDGVFGAMQLWPVIPKIAKAIRGNGLDSGGDFATDGGPNGGWAFIAAPLPDPAPMVYLNKGFNPSDRWYREQDGRRIPAGERRPEMGTRERYCGGKDLDAMRKFILEHEGYLDHPTRTSHVEVWARELPRNDINVTLDTIVVSFQDGYTAEATLRANQAHQRWKARIDSMHRQEVDSEHVEIRCEFKPLPKT